jgi:phenylacetate-coenzyme A ligase PaaK-like adenylate-forming protein
MLARRLYWTAYLAYQMRRQARYPFRSADAIRRDQSRRVRSMVEHAYRHVPYYRETMKRMGLTPTDFRKADLAKLPLLERSQLQRDPLYLVSGTLSPSQLDRCLSLRSAGSTGAPILTYHDASGLIQNAAHGERERSIFAAYAGKAIGYRELGIFQSGARTTAARVQEYCRRQALYPRGVRIQR